MENLTKGQYVLWAIFERGSLFCELDSTTMRCSVGVNDKPKPVDESLLFVFTRVVFAKQTRWAQSFPRALGGR